MAFLLTAFRWLGLKGSLFLLCAFLSASWGGWQHHKANQANAALVLSEARVALLQTRIDAANALAADYERRLADVIAEEQVMARAREAEAAARARQWAGIRKAVPEWSAEPVPAEVVEGLR